jgi:hypothetical protein
LNCEQVVRLYEEIRADADREEEEWREGFAALFHHCAEKLPPPRVDPYHHWHLQARAFPPEWMEDAWANPQIRENIIRGMARHLDRGNDAWCAPDWLDLLDRSLSREHIVALYREFREYVSRPESEWRGIFEEAFPDCAKHFPAPLEGSRIARSDSVAR